MTRDVIFAEFYGEVVMSHSLVVAQILAGEPLEAETLVHLAAELLSIAKIARLLSRKVDYIEEARQCWQEAAGAFRESAQQWTRLSPSDGELIETHRRLLEQLCAMASEQLELYSFSPDQRYRDRY